jgi:alpha-1,3-rhamnosyl/mannosyltransferase
MARKKIFVEGLGLVEGHFSGVGQYILGILRGLDELLDDAKYAGKEVPEVYVVIPYDTVAKFKSFGFKHIRYKCFPLKFRYMAALWHRRKMPPIDLWCGRGKYIFPRFVNMPLAFSGPSPLVIFDLSYELYRQYSDERNAIFLSNQVKASLKSTSKVIAISESARQEIIDFYKIPAKDVLIATPATDPHTFYRRHQPEIDEVKKRYGISGDYILALSNLEPRKNLEALVDVYCRLPKSLRDKYGLLLVGVSGWKTEALFQDIISRVENGFNIIRPTKYVDDKHKAAIISGAKTLVYPSHYEGFGMPPLEALACGVPVITADNSSLPEVVGGVGDMVPSTHRDALYKKLVEYLEDETIEESFKIAGPERAQEFSWVESAKVFLESVGESVT